MDNPTCYWCRRKLRDPKSKENGAGRTCLKKHGKPLPLFHGSAADETDSNKLRS